MSPPSQRHPSCPVVPYDSLKSQACLCQTDLAMLNYIRKRRLVLCLARHCLLLGGI
jgi:hypothetical protein